MDFYITDKTTNSGVAFSLGPEVSYYHGKDGNIYNDNLSGGGYGIEGGVGLGFEYSVDDAAKHNMMPTYSQYTVSAVKASVVPLWTSHTTLFRLWNGESSKKK